MPRRALAAFVFLCLAGAAWAQDSSPPQDENQDDASCDPNYAGKCVPIASDVDCAGGGGNGPAYVRGPVRVVGEDIYKLDRDGDGIACDK
jgi:hypothetical protein